MAKKAKGKEAPKGPARISNRRALYDYHVEESIEAGIVLSGSEVKSLFAGRANLTDAYCRVVNGEMWVFGLDIEAYKYTTHFQPERRRDRKLLLHRKEIDRLNRQFMEKGLALIPLAVYFNERGRAKVQVGLCRGKKSYDKRDAIAERETKRDQARIQRGMRDE